MRSHFLSQVVRFNHPIVRFEVLIVLPNDIKFSSEYKDKLLVGLIVHLGSHYGLHGRSPGVGGSSTKSTVIFYYA